MLVAVRPALELGSYFRAFLGFSREVGSGCRPGAPEAASPLRRVMHRFRREIAAPGGPGLPSASDLAASCVPRPPPFGSRGSFPEYGAPAQLAAEEPPHERSHDREGRREDRDDATHGACGGRGRCRAARERGLVVVRPLELEETLVVEGVDRADTRSTWALERRKVAPPPLARPGDDDLEDHGLVGHMARLQLDGQVGKRARSSS